MVELQINQICLMKDDLWDKEDYIHTIGQQVYLLLKAGYQMKIHTELNENQCLIEYDHDNPELTDARLQWITEEEYYTILDTYSDNEDIGDENIMEE